MSAPFGAPFKRPETEGKHPLNNRLYLETLEFYSCRATAARQGHQQHPAVLLPPGRARGCSAASASGSAAADGRRQHALRHTSGPPIHNYGSASAALNAWWAVPQSLQILEGLCLSLQGATYVICVVYASGSVLLQGGRQPAGFWRLRADKSLPNQSSRTSQVAYCITSDSKGIDL